MSLGVFFLTVLSPFTLLVEIRNKGKRSLSVIGFMAMISPVEKRLMRKETDESALERKPSLQ